MNIITPSAPIKHIMTRHLFLAHPSDSLTKAQSMFDSKQIRHLPVVENHEIVGILSLNDIMRLSFGDNWLGDGSGSSTFIENLQVGDVMRKKPHTIHEDDSIEDAARKLRDETFHALPVVNQGGIVGIVTTTDLIDFFLEGVDSKFNREKNL